MYRGLVIVDKYISYLLLLVLLSAILKIKGLKKSPLLCAIILESRLKNCRNITDILVIGVMNMFT